MCMEVRWRHELVEKFHRVIMRVDVSTRYMCEVSMIGMLVNMFLVRLDSLVRWVGLGGRVSLIRGFRLSSSLGTILALFCVVSGGVGMIFAVLLDLSW